MASAVVPDHTGAAAIYSTSNIFSWAKALAVPGLQAAANIAILDRQKDHYDDVFNDQQGVVNAAVANYVTCLESLLPSYQDAYPDVPDVAEYVPVNPCQEQGDTISCNIGHIAEGDRWAQCINRLHEQSDVVRMIAFDPRYLVKVDLYSLSVQDLLRGKLPVGDVMEVMTDTAETACLQGRIGGCRSLTSRNLGLSKLRAQSAGRDEMRREVEMFEMISPKDRRADIREMMVKPEYRISFALQQNQLIQNSVQNVFNAAAQKAPYLLAQLQTRLQLCTNKLQAEITKLGLTNTYVPNFAAILQPQINAIANTLGGAVSPTEVQSSYDSPSVSGSNQYLNASRAIIVPE